MIAFSVVVKKTILILRRIVGDMIKNVYWSSYKIVNETDNMSRNVSEEIIGNVRREREEGEGSDFEDGDTDTDW